MVVGSSIDGSSSTDRVMRVVVAVGLMVLAPNGLCDGVGGGLTVVVK